MIVVPAALRISVVGVQVGNIGGVFAVDRLVGTVRLCAPSRCYSVQDKLPAELNDDSRTLGRFGITLAAFVTKTVTIILD